MAREDAEAIVRAEFSEQPGLDEIVHTVVDGATEEPDRGYVAHDLWAMGAEPRHDGCRYGPPEPADADYENACTLCETHLLAVADRIIAAIAAGGEQG